LAVGDWLPGDGHNVIARRVISERLQYDDCTWPYTERMLRARHARGEDTPTWWQPPCSNSETVEPPASAAPDPPPARTVFVDPELSRLAVALHTFPVFRVWCYAHALQKGSGWIEKEMLYEALQQLMVAATRRQFNHLLQQGNGRFWTLARATGPDGHVETRFYLRSPMTVAGRLTKWARRQNAALVATNRPGARRIEIDLTGRLQDAEARVYNAWLAHKGESVQIERLILELLWNRRTTTLLTWERRAGIITEPVYAEFDNIYESPVPDHAYLCQATDGSLYASARLPNKYHPVAVNEHPRGGNQRKVCRAANAKLDGFEQPAGVLGGGSGRHSLRTGRLYFGDRQTHRGTTLAYKALDRHLLKHGDLDKRHYLYGTQRHEVTVMLHSAGDPKMVQMRDWKAEQSADFVLRREAFRNWLKMER
jgi:hypothetical protein